MDVFYVDVCVRIVCLLHVTSWCATIGPAVAVATFWGFKIQILPEKLWRYTPTKDLIWASSSIINHQSSVLISQHQPASININRHQSTSISINQHQLVSKSKSFSTNQHQSSPISINKYQSASISINHYQSASSSISHVTPIGINQHSLANPPETLGPPWCYAIFYPFRPQKTV